MLVYDGDCGFCTRSARVIERLVPTADIVAWQDADLPALGLTAEQAVAAVQWIGTDEAIATGHAAVAAALMSGPRWLWPIGRAILLPGVSGLAASAYRLVSDNRHRLPGGTPACRLPAGQRPGHRGGASSL